MTAVSSASVGRIMATHDCPMFLHVPNSTSATLLGDNSSKTYFRKTYNIQGLRVVVMPTAVTSGVTKVEIVAMTSGAGADLTVIKDSGSITLNAVGKNYSLEITGDEIKAAAVSAGKDLPYLSVRLTCGNGNDRAAVAFLEYPITFGGIAGAGFQMTTPAFNTDYLAST